MGAKDSFPRGAKDSFPRGARPPKTDDLFGVHHLGP
jgi:hypothetical protein